MIGLAAAIAGAVNVLGKTVDPSTKSRIASSTTTDELREIIRQELEIVSEERNAQLGTLQQLVQVQDQIISILLDQAKGLGAPGPVLKQPKWSTSSGEPTLDFGKD